MPDIIIDTIIKYNDEDYASEKTRLLALNLPNTINEKGFTILYKKYLTTYSKEYGFGYNDEAKEIKYYLICFEDKRCHEDYINLINT